MRSIIACLVILCLFSAISFSDEFDVVIKSPKIDKSIVERCGLMLLASGDDYLLLQGDLPALERLRSQGIGFSEIASIEPGENVFLLRPRTPEAEIIYGEIFKPVDQSTYLATARLSEIEGLDKLPFEKVRLTPYREVGIKPVNISFDRPMVTPKPIVAQMVSSVSPDSIWKYISQLSGAQEAPVGDHTVFIPTRYSYSSWIDTAAVYLYEQFSNLGLDAEYHYYTVGKYDFYAVSFVDSLHGWVVGSDQRIFKTEDGGSSWVRQNPNSPNTTWWGVCFIDSLNGWICGTGGKIYRTSDGGATWVKQTSPTTATLREICFLDNQNGWIVGYGGVILRTTNGGTNWSLVSSGVSTDLYGLHFVSLDRGWACGSNGKILFWDGSNWTQQSSGTSEYLLDVYFAGDNIGWIVGGGATILKTTDGGENWIAQEAPAGIDPYLKGVCFVDSVTGWAVGLSGTIIHTSDGINWTEQQSGTLFGLRWVNFINDHEGWTVGYGGTILHTSDAGGTWENQRANLPSGALLSWKNVVATKNGKSHEQVIICGHYDCTSQDPYNLAPGADDNASGTAAVLEAARILSGYSFDRVIKFVCFSGEEQGLFGSGEYATDAKFSGADISGVLNFDMIAYVNSPPEDIDLIGDYESEWLVDFTIECSDAYIPSLPTLKVINPNETYSDHASFWRAGYSALCGIEDNDVSYPYYHTVGDTIGNLFQDFASDVVRLAVATIAELAVPDTLGSGVTDRELRSLVETFPNPISTDGWIKFYVPRSGIVNASLYDVRGREVRSLFEGNLKEGINQIRIDLPSEGSISPGIYFLRIRGGGAQYKSKVVIVR
ncbi:MAG: YCF48-related protein [bacterium]